jgi:hypothetical protein
MASDTFLDELSGIDKPSGKPAEKPTKRGFLDELGLTTTGGPLDHDTDVPQST